MKNDLAGFVSTAVSPERIKPNEMTAVFVDGTHLLLTRVEDNIVAFMHRCPHAGAKFIEGEISRYKLFCPDHGYCFDLRNGRILYPADETYRLKKYAVQLDAGQVWVKINQ